MVLTFGAMLSPGLVSNHVSEVSAPCHPGSDRSPSMVIGPAARWMVSVLGASAASTEEAMKRRRTSSRYTDGYDGAEGSKLAFVRIIASDTKGFVIGCKQRQLTTETQRNLCDLCASVVERV